MLFKKIITVLFAMSTSAAALRGTMDRQQHQQQDQGLDFLGNMSRTVRSAGKGDEFLGPPQHDVGIDAADGAGSRKLLLETQAPTAADTPVESMFETDPTWYPDTHVPTAAPTRKPTAAPTPAPTLAPPRVSKKACTVTNFVLWDAITNKPLKKDGLKLYDKAEICYAAMPDKVNIEANAKDCVGKVRLELKGKSNRNQMEQKSPYMLAGDEGGKVHQMNLPVGNYVLSAIPDDIDSLKKEISFSIVRC